MSKNSYLFLFVACSCLLSFALYIQHLGWLGVHYPPCPLCILQRIAFLLIAVMCLMAFCFEKTKKIFYYLALLACLSGVVIALRHQWVIAYPESSCGLDPLEVFINQFSFVQAIPFFFKADGFCSMPLPPILFLSVPMWSLLFFAVLICLLSALWFLNPERNRNEF
jgi:disulfide bond formation protein DsbB